MIKKEERTKDKNDQKGRKNKKTVKRNIVSKGKKEQKDRAQFNSISNIYYSKAHNTH